MTFAMGGFPHSGPQQKWAAEDETVGWHHQLNGHEFKQTPGDGEGQGIYSQPYPMQLCQRPGGSN